MPITRLNHAVLYVRDAQKSAGFYTNVLGMTIKMQMGDNAIFLVSPNSENDHDLGLFSIGENAGPTAAGRDTVGMYHLAWQVDTLAELERIRAVLAEHGALTGQSDHGTTKSLYGKDPDGLEFEIMWPVPFALIDDATREAAKRINRLDLEREKERYGATTPATV